jgi:hypothetical protein
MNQGVPRISIAEAPGYPFQRERNLAHLRLFVNYCEHQLRNNAAYH